MSEEEEKPKAKEEEIFGFKKADLGAMLGAGALLGVIGLAVHVLKPQLPNLQPQQQQPAQQQQQPQQMTSEQQQIAAQQQQEPQQPVQYGYATEHDPLSGKVVRTRVREIESNETGG